MAPASPVVKSKSVHEPAPALLMRTVTLSPFANVPSFRFCAAFVSVAATVL